QIVLNPCPQQTWRSVNCQLVLIGVLIARERSVLGNTTRARQHVHASTED
ncbi:hypothetical protein BgiMline_032773, partial [Biomphalaria glabrata]